MTTTQAAQNGFALLAAATKKKAVAKQESAVVQIPEARALFNDLLQAKQDLKDAQARAKMLSHDAAAVCEPKRVELSRAQKKALSSINLGDLLYISQNRYSAIKDRSDAVPDEDSDSETRTLEEQEAALRELFGEDFDSFFISVFKLEVDVNKITSEQAAQLAEMDPKGERMLKPTEALHAARTLDEGVREKCEAAHIHPVAFLKAV